MTLASYIIVSVSLFSNLSPTPAPEYVYTFPTSLISHNAIRVKNISWWLCWQSNVALIFFFAASLEVNPIAAFNSVPLRKTSHEAGMLCTPIRWQTARPIYTWVFLYCNISIEQRLWMLCVIHCKAIYTWVFLYWNISIEQQLWMLCVIHCKNDWWQ